MSVDFVVVGSGLTGAVVARTLVDAGRSVCIVERRSHIGGNVHDQDHESGIRAHTYGPHYFRTNSEKMWLFVNRFAPFRRFEPVIKTYIDGKYENWPIAGSYIRRTIGCHWKPEFNGVASNFEEASLSMMPRPIYEKFIRGYTEKQWGVPAHDLSAALATRFDVREDDEPRLTRHEFQGLPENGYSHFMKALSDNIPITLNCDYIAHRTAFPARVMTIFTGPIDEFFDFDLGRLKYRGQQREYEYRPNTAWAQPSVQVNNPDPANGPHIRTLEWKHMMKADDLRGLSGTLLTREITVTPTDPNDYEYPFPDDGNARLYRRYAERARHIPKLLICGRLGEYRYYDMDQAIARACTLARRLLDAEPSPIGVSETG